jgi:protein-tyrosine phosphatase
MQYIDKISNGIYIGSTQCLETPEILQSVKITQVLYLGTSMISSKCSFKVIEIPDTINTDIIDYFEESYDYINSVLKDQGNILICCDTGISIGPTIVIAYIMKRKCCSYARALEFVKKLHPQTRPNSGFITQLRTYQGRVMKKPQIESLGEIRCGCECF